MNPRVFESIGIYPKVKLLIAKSVNTDLCVRIVQKLYLLILIIF
jgi:hypothetical protein